VDRRGRLVVRVSGRFQVVYADPAWSYDNRTIRGGAEHHYPTMTVEQICALPVAKLAAPDAALFLWATWPTLPDALRVIDAWGFKFKNCAFTWVKTTKTGGDAVGLGHWTRGNTEPCLFATRGRPQRVDASVRQVLLTELAEETIFAERGRHSAKPPETRDRIVRLMGDVPRIELFARDRVAGWHAWGNQVPPATVG
jgi:N6-adenosine-specific RNA methylase IME4